MLFSGVGIGSVVNLIQSDHPERLQEAAAGRADRIGGLRGFQKCGVERMAGTGQRFKGMGERIV